MSFKEQLLKETEGSDLNFDKLLQMIEDENIPMFNAVLGNRMYGLATKDGIYVNILEIVHRSGYDLLYFTILHEIAHYKRLLVYSKEELFNKILESDEATYINHTINEEVIADRYGRLIFRILNGEQFPINKTQELEEEDNKIKYSKRLVTGFKHMKSQCKSVEDFDNVINSFVVHVR